MKKVALVTPFPVLAGESVDDAAIFFLETTLQLYKNSRGGSKYLWVAAFNLDDHRFAHAPASLPTVVPGAYCCSNIVQRF